MDGGLLALAAAIVVAALLLRRRGGPEADEAARTLQARVDQQSMVTAMGGRGTAGTSAVSHGP